MRVGSVRRTGSSYFEARSVLGLCLVGPQQQFRDRRLSLGSDYVWIGTGDQQLRDGFQLVQLAGQHEWCSSARVGMVHVGTGPDQPIEHSETMPAQRGHERRLPLIVQ